MKHSDIPKSTMPIDMCALWQQNDEQIQIQLVVSLETIGSYRYLLLPLYRYSYFLHWTNAHTQGAPGILVVLISQCCLLCSIHTYIYINFRGAPFWPLNATADLCLFVCLWSLLVAGRS